MFAHLNAAPPSVTELVPDAPSEFDEVIRRALAKNPDDRYPSAGDLARAVLAASERRALGVVTERSVGVGEAAPADHTGATGPGSGGAHEAPTRALPPLRASPDTGEETEAATSVQGGRTADGGSRRRRWLTLSGGVIVVLMLVAVVALVLPSHGQASAAVVADKWLRLHENGDDGQAAALWNAPVSYVEAFPAVRRHFGSIDAVRSYWSGRTCKLTLVSTTTVGASVAVLRVLANGERYGGGSKCSSDGTYYDDRFTVKSGHIVAAQSVLAPVSVAGTWLRLHDQGSDQTASALWAASSSVTTVDPPKTYKLSGAASVASFWLSRGCDLKPQASPTDQGSDQVALRVLADAPRPNIAKACGVIGASYVLHFTLSAGHITKLAFTTSA